MINRIVKYSWLLTIIIFSSALLSLDDHFELVADAVFYMPLPMLLLGLFVSIPENKRIRMTLIALSSIGLIVGIGFTLIVMNSSGGQGGVGLFIASAIIGGIYVISLLCIFVGQAVFKRYSAITHNKELQVTRNPRT